MSLESSFSRVIESVSPSTAHAVGVGSGLTGIALWAELAKHLTVVAGLLVALFALVGGLFYAIYWALKSWAKLCRIRKGDYSE